MTPRRAELAKTLQLALECASDIVWHARRAIKGMVPLVFLRNARVAMAGAMPDDDEWPVAGGGSE